MGINTKLWEWSPTISPSDIPFGRNSFRTLPSPWKVILYNRTTGVSKILASVQNRCECIFPGQGTDQYATWTKCSSTLCQSWYYTIATGALAKIPNPLGKQTWCAAGSSMPTSWRSPPRTPRPRPPTQERAGGPTAVEKLLLPPGATQR